MKRNAIATCLLLCVLCLRDWANNGDIEKDLKSDYVGKTLTLRHFYHGDHLKFSSDGTLQGDAPFGPWTVDGRIEVEKVRLNGSLLEFQGRRINVVFDAHGNHGKPVDQLTTLDQFSGKQRTDMEKSLRERKVRIEIELPSTPDQDQVRPAVQAVFLMLGESMMDVVPPFWRSYIADLEGKRYSMSQLPAEAVSRVSPPGIRGGVSAPRAITAPDPEYSELARKTKFSGTTVLWLIVNTRGEPQDIR